MNGSSTTTRKCFSFSVTYLEDCVQKLNSSCVRHLQLSINLLVEEVSYKDLVSEGYTEMKSSIQVALISSI